MPDETYPRVAIRDVIIDLLAHLVSAVIAVILIYITTRNLVYAGIFVVGALMVDMDHLVDYCIYYRTRFRLKDFVSARYLASGKVYLFLHSWELNLLVFIWALIVQSAAVWMLFLGLTVHLTIDNLQRGKPFFYFIVYRLYNKFDSHVLLPERRSRR